MHHEHVQSYIVNLPTELHLRIINKLLVDPETSIDKLRSLRLVCKLFDKLWSPIVLINMTLISSYPTYRFLVNQLRNLVRDEGTTAAFTTTLKLRNWDGLDTGINRFFQKLQKLWYKNGYLGLIQIPICFFIIPPISLFRLLLTPQDIPKHFMNTLNCIQSMYYASFLPRKLRLPHLHSVRLFFSRESRWATYQLTRMLSVFSQLTELELIISVGVRMACAARCLRHLRSLRKFQLVILHDRELEEPPQPEINRFSSFIAHNHNISHLSILSYAHKPVDLSGLFLDVPSSRPLVLEHFSCDDNCQNFEALLPYIRSLSSFEFQGKKASVNTWCTTLLKAGIFPPIIKAGFLDPQLSIYLRKHPAIVGLSLYEYGESQSAYTDKTDELCSILVRHSGTLRYLWITSRTLAFMLRTLQNGLDFRRCKNLREIVLIGRYGLFYSESLTSTWWGKRDAPYEKQVLPLLAHLNCSLTVVLKGSEVARLDACAEYCRQSDDPFVRDLAGRLVYEPL